MRGQTLYQFTNGKGSGDKCGVQPCKMQDFFARATPGCVIFKLNMLRLNIISVFIKLPPVAVTLKA